MQKEWIKLKDKLKRYSAKWNKADYKNAITDFIPSSALLGNGDIAITSYGSDREKTYLISKGDFWNCGDLKTNALRGENPRRVSPITVGGITIQEDKLQKEESDTSQLFEEILDVSQAELETNMFIGQKGISFNAWVVATENVFVIEITSAMEDSIKLKVSLWAKEGNALWPTTARSKGNRLYVSRKTVNLSKDNPKSWTSEVIVGMQLLNQVPITIDEQDTNQVHCHLEIPSKEKIQIIVAIGGGGKTYDYTGVLQQEEPSTQVNNLINQNNSRERVLQLKDEHKRWWRDYWMKSYIDIGDKQLEKYYYGSLYYLASTAREDKLIPGIMGNWITTDSVMWNGDYHMNYNMIGPFYGVYASNRPELARSLKDPLLDYMEEGKLLAKNDVIKVFPNYINGGEGNRDFFEEQGGHGVYTGDFKGREELKNGIDDAVLYPVALGPWGSTTWRDENGGYLTQMNDAGFSAQALTTYYRYTLDDAYLKEIYPFLVANANFYEKWCEKEQLGEGRYRYNVYSGAHEGTFELNAPNILGTMRNILSCLIETGPIMSPPQAKLDIWKDMFDHMADYPIEIYDGEDYEFNQPIIPLGEKGIKFVPRQAPVNLEFVCPSNQIGFNTSPELLEAIRNSIVLKEVADQDTWYQINNTAKIFTMAIKSGYDPVYIMDKFKMLLDQQAEENFTINDYVHGIEKAGGIEFINNMLLQSHDHMLKVFPNWDVGKDAEFINLRGEGAFLISSRYDAQKKEVAYIKIKSLMGGRVCVVSPWGEGYAVHDKDGNNVKVQEVKTTYSEETTCLWDTEVNETYMLKHFI